MDFEFEHMDRRNDPLSSAQGSVRRYKIWNSGPYEPSESLSSSFKFGYEYIDIRNLPDGHTLNATIITRNVCRICATYYPSGPDLLPLFSCCELTARPLASILNEYLPKLVTQNDGLPMVMCLTCAKKVQAWRVVRFKCMEAQGILSKHVGLRNTMPELPSFTAPTDRTIHLVDLTDSTDEDDAIIVELPPRILPRPYSRANMPAAT